MTQPFQGWLRSPCRPRVAAAQQPWADIRSPFRAKKSALPNPPGTLKPEEPEIPELAQSSLSVCRS